MSRPAPPMSVAIVSFNTRDLLAQCVTSVLAARPERVVVVDNASSDGTVELVRARFPGVHLIANDDNRGYGAAANQAVAACATPAVLLLNSDTLVAPDCVATLGSYLAAHPTVAVVGPRLANADGTLQRSTYPFPAAADIVLGETPLHLLVRRIPGLRERFWRTWSHDVARPVPWVLGAALAIRRAAFDSVAGFDESYFLYSEEVDLCRRLATAGFEVHYAPVTTVVHFGGESTRQVGEAMRRELIVSKARYLRRHETRSRAARVLLTLRIIATVRLLRDLARLRVSRDREEQTRLRTSVEAWKSILSEHALWQA
jgi:N-acetylglucosaminyl-diphospho-decaprenol L-rhamnosyltransferase